MLVLVKLDLNLLNTIFASNFGNEEVRLRVELLKLARFDEHTTKLG